MAKLDIFPACRMKAFAALVSRELGVQVRLRGREICVLYGKPPTIFLPNLEMAREQDLLPLYGFCLHEAAHICFSDPKMVRRCPNYMLKLLHNAIEDVFIEGRLERNFPGAREMLTCSYVDGINRVMDGKPVVPERSYLAPECRDDVIGVMRGMKLDDSDGALVDKVAKRLEIDRAAKLWIIARRGYPLPLYEWPTHPWREVFEHETKPPARSTKQGYAQALRIIERLGVEPVFPDDVRPVDVIDKAKELKEAANAARRSLRAARRERDVEIARQCRETPEHAALERAVAEVTEAETAARNAAAANDSERQSESNRRLVEAREAEAQARREFNAKRKEIAEQVRAERAAELSTLRADKDAKSSEAHAGAEAAARAAGEIKARDAVVDAHVDKERLERLIQIVMEGYKAQDVADELAATPGAFKGRDAVAFPGADAPTARKYCAFDRSLDRVEKIDETPTARSKKEDAVRLHQEMIHETTERLRRLRAPQRSKLKFNAERGRLDPRQAFKVGIATRGAPVDVSKVWRTTVESIDAKIAVSLLIDCSGSMSWAIPGGGTRISLARQAAACLSEVLDALAIPYEILGHTTVDEDADKLEFSPADTETFSRVVPFRGYEFKAFADKASARVFSDFAMQSNLDGEAVTWAARRLAERRERTKLLIVVSDGMPCAELSNMAELERHLYTTAKQIEAREKDGLHLAALGIAEERVRRFYRNAEVIRAVGELPQAVLRIVERVMGAVTYPGASR